MKLSYIGVSFKYHGDELTWYWPWVGKTFKATYFSSLFSRDFNSLKDYWKAVGKEEALSRLTTCDGKVYGASYKEVIAEWSKRIWPGEFLVAMLEPDYSMKGPAFMARLTSQQRHRMMQDVVILRAKDKTEAEHLLESIDITMSEAYLVHNGNVLLSNNEPDDWSPDEWTDV
jgi:hypothetical protein